MSRVRIVAAGLLVGALLAVALKIRSAVAALPENFEELPAEQVGEMMAEEMSESDDD